MTINDFEEIIAWQKARELSNETYAIFSRHNDFGFRDQILRASVSVMNNIAEGFDRGSKQEFCHFLVISRGSAAEVRSMLTLAQDLGYMTDEQKQRLTGLTKDIARLLTALIKSLKTDNGKLETAK